MTAILLNTLIDLFSLLISVLILTGGIWGKTLGISWELSQVNGIMALFLLFLILRYFVFVKDKKYEPYIIILLKNLMRFIEKSSRLQITICISVLFLMYCIPMGFLVIKRHLAFESNAYDLGLFDQILWNTTQGNVLISSLKQNHNYLTDHFSPILIILVPVYLLAQFPQTLLLLQTILFGISGIFVYLVARSILESKLLALTWMFSFLSYLPLRMINIFDFHAVALAIPLLLCGYTCYLRGRKNLSFLVCILAGFCKEEVLLVVLLFGIVMYFIKRERLYGFSLASFSLVFFIAGIFILPALLGREYVYINRYTYLGSSLSEILRTILSHPGILLSRIFSLSVLIYICRLIFPLAGLPLLGPIFLIMCLPTFIANMLSSLWQQRSLQYHYASSIIPFLFIAGIHGTKHLMEKETILWIIRVPAFLKKKRVIAGILIACTLLFYGRSEMRRIRDLYINPDFNSCRQTISRYVPLDATLCTESYLVPHFSGRKEIYLFPEIRGSEYIVFYDALDSWPLPRDERNRLKKELPEKGYELIHSKKGLHIYRKKEEERSKGKN